MKRRWWYLDVAFAPRDIWIGLRWKYDQHDVAEELSVFLCVLPCLPFILTRVTYR